MTPHKKLEMEILRVMKVDRQAERFQHQKGRFIDGVGGAVAVGQAGDTEAANREPEEVTQGDERGIGGAGHAGLDYPT